jgi:branched-chain amino acid transport system permease protein
MLAYLSFFLTVVAINAIACLGLNLQWGFAGLFNVGVAGFVAVGAYTSALLTAAPAAGRLGGFELPILVGWIAAMLVSGAAAAAIGALTLRLRADYLAITTFGIATCIQLVALNAEHLTGGPFGIAFIPRPFASLAGASTLFGLANLALVAGVCAVVFVLLDRLTHSPWGRVLRAVREDEEAARSLGKSANRYRLQAFVIGAMLMGLAGAVQAQFFGFIAPESYLPTLTFQIWVMLVVGGSGNHRGAVLGAALVWALWTLSGGAFAALLPADLQARAASLRIVAIGVVLSGMLLWRPRGLLGETTVISRHVAARAEPNG